MNLPKPNLCPTDFLGGTAQAWTSAWWDLLIEKEPKEQYCSQVKRFLKGKKVGENSINFATNQIWDFCDRNSGVVGKIE